MTDTGYARTQAQLGTIAVAFLMVAAVVEPAPAQPADGLRVGRSATSGRATFVTAEDGGPISVVVPAGRVDLAPTAFLEQHGRIFGVTDAAAQLTLDRVDTDLLGFTHSTFHQVQNGVPVFSGVLKVHQDPTGQITAVNGDFYAAAVKVNTVPDLTPGQAEQRTTGGLLAGTAPVERNELVIVDPGWYGDPPRGPRLAYYIIRNNPEVPIRRAFFVDAHSGQVLDQWDMIHTVTGRKIHDAEGLPSLPGTRVRVEGDPPSGDPEVDAAYDWTGDTLGYFERAFGHVGVDGVNPDVTVTVNYGSNICPNAFWNGAQLVFCPGVVTDDILAHEFSHGVTEFSAGLIYQNQPGQLNESYSDVFGELVDLFNGNAAFPGDPSGSAWPDHPTGPGLDVPNNLRTDQCSYSSLYPDGVRWLVGEDSSSFGGAIRDMWKPTCFGDPDRANSPLQDCKILDNGGVHSGSGVANHAFAIVTDGKDFNGHQITGIGPVKSGAVWYRALTNYHTPATDFLDAHYGFHQAALDLIGSFPNDPRTGEPIASQFTADDAAQVEQTMIAVEMDTQGGCGFTLAQLDLESPGLCGNPEVIYADDFELGTDGWTVSNDANTPYDWIQRHDLPLGREGTVWFCEDRNVGDCGARDESAVHSLTSPPIELPDTLNLPELIFDHNFNTEAGFDGGNLKYRIGEGAWQIVPASAFTYNPYNAQPMLEASGGSTNPLAGQPGFTATSGGWGTSVVSLRDLVAPGQTVQFRFDFGKDGCTGWNGWFVDNFQVRDCAQAVDCNANGVADDAELATEGEWELIVQHLPQTIDLVVSDGDRNGLGPQSHAENFTMARPGSVSQIRIWGAYSNNGSNVIDDFTVVFHPATGDRPGEVERYLVHVPVTRQRTGRKVFGYYDEWTFDLHLLPPIELEAGEYFVQIFNNTDHNSDTFFWETADYTGVPSHAVSDRAPGFTWGTVGYNLAIEVRTAVRGADCNQNGVPDDCDVADGAAVDCDGNGILDACELTDCNSNGTHDACELIALASTDCNGNLVLDECELQDCNTNGTHDACDVTLGGSEDCNGNFRPDECDIAAGQDDCDRNGVLDQCEFTDCNTNGRHDGCDLAEGFSNDCNGNDIPDDCDIASGAASDCNTNGIPDRCDESSGASDDCNNNNVLDECEMVDCNTNGRLDSCDIDVGDSGDCNRNQTPDECDIAAGSSSDSDADGVPDECQQDCNSNGVPDFIDIDEGAGDCDENGIIDECEFADCNSNGRHDPCDLLAGFPDVNSNGIPDGCDECLVDADCADGVFCNGTETCAGGACLPGQNPCPGLLCLEIDQSCQAASEPDCLQDADCNDGFFCNGVEVCDAGLCTAGQPPCDADTCDEATDTCVECLADTDCDDGRYCNGLETCAADGTCTAGTPPCTGDLVCNESSDACVECVTDADCGDADPCTADSCNDGTCANQSIPACPDADGDGVTDSDDACPNTPAGAVVDAAGCACRQLDEDGDGINNCLDVCPGTPPSTLVNAVGCAIPEPGRPRPPEDDADEPEDPTPPDQPGADNPADDGNDQPSADDGSDPPGDPVPADDVDDGSGAGEINSTGRSARRSTCGALGTVNLALLLLGMAVMAASRRR